MSTVLHNNIERILDNYMSNISPHENDQTEFFIKTKTKILNEISMLPDEINIVHKNVSKIIDEYMEFLVQRCKEENMKSSPNIYFQKYFMNQIMIFDETKYEILKEIKKDIEIICLHCNKTFRTLNTCKKYNLSYCHEFLNKIDDPYCRFTGDYICKKCDGTECIKKITPSQNIDYLIGFDCPRSEAIKELNKYCGNDKEKIRDIFLGIRSVGFLRCLNPNCKNPSESRNSLYYSPNYIVNCSNCK